MSAGLSQLLGEHEFATFVRIADTKRFDDLDEVVAVDVAYDYGTGEDQHGLVAWR